MSILVTGGAGFIGSHTSVEFLNCGYDIVVVDNFSNSDISVIEKIKNITGKQFAFYELDLIDEYKLGNVFYENTIDTVIHFAGFKAVGESVEDPLKYYHNNITSTLVLIKTMKKHNVKKLIFSSSATVYGNPNIYGNDYNTHDGTGVRDYIHVVDLAKGHLKALDRINDISGVNIYNLGTGKGYSVLDVITTFEKINGVKVPYVFTGRRPGDIAQSFCDASKAERELNWKAEKSLEDMCRDSWNWQIKSKRGEPNA